MEDFELDVKDALRKTAKGESLTVSVVGEGGELFHRRAVVVTPDGVQEPATMLVARLAGVSLYVRDSELVLTTADVYL